MIFDWTVSLGQLVQVVVMLFGFGLVVQRFYYAIDKRVSVIERELVVHAEKVEIELSGQREGLASQDVRMERWESTVFKLVSDLSRVVGQMEHRRDGYDRRSKE